LESSLPAGAGLVREGDRVGPDRTEGGWGCWSDDPTQAPCLGTCREDLESWTEGCRSYDRTQSAFIGAEEVGNGGMVLGVVSSRGAGGDWSPNALIAKVKLRRRSASSYRRQGGRGVEAMQ
jgi:hypothetical protein